MASLESNLFNGLTHFPISDQCNLHEKTFFENTTNCQGNKEIETSLIEFETFA